MILTNVIITVYRGINNNLSAIKIINNNNLFAI
jgi:hypothetical protein